MVRIKRVAFRENVKVLFTQGQANFQTVRNNDRCSFQAGVCKAGFYCNFFFEIIFEAKFFHFIRFWCTFLIGRWGSWAIFSFLFFLKNFVALALPVFLTNAILLNKRPSPPFSGKTKTCDPPPSVHFFLYCPTFILLSNFDWYFHRQPRLYGVPRT